MSVTVSVNLILLLAGSTLALGFFLAVALFFKDLYAHEKDSIIEAAKKQGAFLAPDALGSSANVRGSASYDEYFYNRMVEYQGKGYEINLCREIRTGLPTVYRLAEPLKTGTKK